MSPSPTDATGLDFVCMEIKWLCKRSSHQLWEKIRGQGYGLFACLCVWFVAIENFTDLTYWESENWWIFFQGSQSKLDRKERNGSHRYVACSHCSGALAFAGGFDLLFIVVVVDFMFASLSTSSSPPLFLPSAGWGGKHENGGMFSCDRSCCRGKYMNKERERDLVGIFFWCR